MPAEADVVIVGAGPAGLSVARLLRGVDALVVTASKPGYPPHCTGLVSVETARLYPREALTEYYDMLRVIVGKHVLELRVKLARLDRPLLEQILAQEVVDAGHRLVVDTPVHLTRLAEKGKIIVKSLRGFMAYAESLVIAEGASPLHAETWGFRKPRVVYGYQLLVKLDKRMETVWVALKDSGAFYKWVVPVKGGRYALVGSVAPEPRIAAIVAKRLALMHGGKVLDVRASPIPFSLPPRKLCREVGGARVCIAGDSAGLTKATSGGGLYAIARASKYIASFLEEGRDALESWIRIRRVLTKHYMLAVLYYKTPVSKLMELVAAFAEKIWLVSYDELRVEKIAWRKSATRYRRGGVRRGDCSQGVEAH